ncbi:MAG: nucleotide exchange factor GrpE [Eubacterium sp.]|nr:nucleotide exchange factor GrpE [Eubacterium sp.]
MAKKKEKKPEEQNTSEIEIEDIGSEAEPEDADPADTAEDGKQEKDAEDKEGQEAGAEGGNGSKTDSEEDEAWNEKYTRLMADFQNFRKRTEKEKADVYSFANEKIMTDLLQVIDNFERALGSDCQDQAYAEGMQMIFKQLTDILKNSGLEEIEAVGHDFDPNFHHAVLTDSNPDFDSGKVTEVLQKGYKLNGKVIRPSMVKVNE